MGLKDVAPSIALRKWFDHDPVQWAEFQTRYHAELKRNPAFDELKKLAHQGNITLIYAARDQVHNEAVVLQQLLEHGH